MKKMVDGIFEAKVKKASKLYERGSLTGGHF